MIRVVVADDQPLACMALRTLIAGEDDIELVAEASDGVAALAAIRRERPDVVIMDVRMPQLDGIEALRHITAEPELAGTRVVVLTTFGIDDHIFDALRAGASGFLTKDVEPTELLHAIRVVAAGESLLSPTVTRTVIGRFARSTTARPVAPAALRGMDRLTDREREIVGWVAAGLSNDEIAARLVVSPATMRTHLSRAMQKTHARDRAQLVVFAYQSGLAIPEA
jgi:DNA-binding NarL/FixJ family response regulator